MLWREEDTRPYECDGLTMYRQLPMVVALPETEDQVARSRACVSKCKCRSWRAAPAPGCRAARCRIGRGVLLSLAKFNRIIEIDPARAHGASCSRACATSRSPRRRRRYGLYYAPDPSSQIACTIGGNVAENSGGVHCLKYGLTRAQRAARARRDHRRRNRSRSARDALDAPGYDLLALMIGSRRHAARSSPRSRSSCCRSREFAQVVMASFDDVGKARRCGGRSDRRRHHPGGPGDDGQAGDRARSRTFVHAGYDLDAAAILLANPTARARKSPRRSRASRRCCARAAQRGSQVSRVETPSGMRFWAGRKAAFPGGGPDLARLLLHGRHDPAQAPRRSADGDRRRWKPSTACAAPTSSTPATATCTR